MAGDPSLQLAYYLSGGGSNVDADLSLGGARSTQQVRATSTTVAANGAVGDVRVSLASVLWGGQANSYIYFRKGALGGWGSDIVAVDTSAEWVQLLDPLPSTIAIGDPVLFFMRASIRNPFKLTSALESALGYTHYLGLYLTNNGANLSNFRFWIEQANPGPASHEIAASNSVLHTLVTIPNLQTAPDLSTLLDGDSGAWIPARNYASGSPDFTLETGSVGFWLKRIVPPNSVRLSHQAIAIVGEAGGGVVSKLYITWDTAGFTPTLSLSHAPTVYLRGGARFKATVIGEETGLRVPNVPVGFAITSGPGTISAPPDPGVTDENGEILGRYAAPADVGEIGQVVTVEAQV